MGNLNGALNSGKSERISYKNTSPFTKKSSILGFLQFSEQHTMIILNPNRVMWPDYVKGIAIILVVIGHVQVGLQQAKIITSNPWYTFQFSWLYSFHVPAFFFISGLFAMQTARRYSLAIFIKDKARTILYPYFIWYFLQTFLMLGLSSQVNHKVTFLNFLLVFYNPFMQFWFLYSLFIIMVLFILLQKLRCSSLMILAFSVVVYLVSIFLLPSTGVIPGAFHNMIYFSSGLCVGPALLNKLERISVIKLFGFSILSFVIMTILLKCGITPWMPLRFLLAVLGISGLVGVGGILARQKSALWIQTIGILSLEIYVAQTIFYAGIRICLQKALAINNPYLHWSFGIVAGICFPLLLWWLCKKLKFPYLFRLLRPR